MSSSPDPTFRWPRSAPGARIRAQHLRHQGGGAFQTSRQRLLTNKVRLYFPKTDLEVCTTSKILSASPFFRALFDSGFAEASTTRKRQKLDPAAPPESVDVGQDALAFEDSDDKADELYLKQDQPSVDPGEADFREVRISATAYSTYRAVLTWLSTTHITFAPLSSHWKVPPASKCQLRSLYSSDFAKANPALSFSVSPKSVYRLADFLQLPDLKSLAVEAYKSQLDENTVAWELVSDVSAVYEELRFAALDVAVKDFANVRTSEAMQEVTRMMKDNEALRERFADIMAELLARG